MPKGCGEMTAWSEAEIMKAKALWDEGRSGTEIAAALGRAGRSSVLGMMARNRDLFPLSAVKRNKGGPVKGAPRNNSWTEDDLDRAAALWAKGEPASVIAAALGRTEAAVRLRMHMSRARFAPRPTRIDPTSPARTVRLQGWSAGQAETAAGMWALRRSTSEIAEAVGKSVNAVQAYAVAHPDRFAPRGRVAWKAKAPPPTAIKALPLEGLAARFPTQAPPQAAKPVTLMERREGQCAYGLWDSYGPKPDASSLYCGAPTHGEGSYCLHHRALMYLPRIQKSEHDATQRQRAA
jgi:hypothetical protein